VQAGARILRECYGRSGGNWGKSFSCYYSGDFSTGYRHGYVQKVYSSMRRGTERADDAVAPIQVVDRATRRSMAPNQKAASAADDRSPASLVARRGTPVVAPSQLAAEGHQPETSAQGNIHQPDARMQTDATSSLGPFVQTVAAAVVRPAVAPLPYAGDSQQRAAYAPVSVTARNLSQATRASAPVAGTGGRDSAFVF
jgi:type IV secretion system protein VirB1